MHGLLIIVVVVLTIGIDQTPRQKSYDPTETGYLNRGFLEHTLLNWISAIISWALQCKACIAKENLVVVFHLRSIKLMIAARSLKVLVKAELLHSHVQ
jgi:hypothetical protein